jgi:pimeloyl-ACP methyl ester carboxylesterase
MKEPTHHFIDARGMRLHVVEQGTGPVVLFCHGFPHTWYIWSSAMRAVADAGFRAVALDMRGYGESDAPHEAEAYTPFHTVGDIVAVLDHMSVPQAILVGHDFGANIVWNAAMMRPDRVAAVCGVSVPPSQPGGPSFLDQLRAAGKHDYYMFAQMRPEADDMWADAARTIPASHYWVSGEPPAEERWDPMDPAKHALRPIDKMPRTISADYFAHTIEAFQRTGFHGALNYYRAIDAFFAIANRAYAGAVIRQPSFFLTGAADGLNKIRLPTEERLRAVLPGLRGFVLLEGVGHLPQLEAPERFNVELLSFLKSLP